MVPSQRRLAHLATALVYRSAPAAAGPAGGRPCISAKEEELVADFLTAPAFAVVGASKNRTKFGNKILRCYLQHGKATTPVSPKEPEVENVAAIKALTELAGDVSSVGVSVITPPPVTLQVLDELSELGITKVWLQPGAENDEVVAKCAALGIDALSVSCTNEGSSIQNED